MGTSFFTDAPVVDWTTANRRNRDLYGKFFHAVAEGGRYLAPSQIRSSVVGTAHNDRLLTGL